MFINFKISNYLSIDDEQEINFANTFKGKIKEVNKVSCIVGANGSGKTNILKGILSFLLFSLSSYLPKIRAVIKLKPHFSNGDKPSGFSTEWIVNNKRYFYSISIFKSEIISENLKEMGEHNRYKSIFSRSGSKINSSVIKISKRDLERITNKGALLSFLSEYEYINKYDKDMLKPFQELLFNLSIDEIDSFSSEPNFINFLKYTSEKLKDKNIFDALIKELKIIDSGIQNISLKKGLVRRIDSNTKEIIDSKEIDDIFMTHKSKGKDYKLPILNESEGTKNYIALFIRLYNVLSSGGFLIADELEDSLHVDLVDRILGLFMDKRTNPNNAQLLFSTHNPWFLQFLNKTQIFIIEKGDDSDTQIIRLDDIEGVRNDENYFLKYINGAYDGKPKIRESISNG